MSAPTNNSWPHPPWLGLHLNTEIHFIRCNSVAMSKKLWKCRTNSVLEKVKSTDGAEDEFVTLCHFSYGPTIKPAHPEKQTWVRQVLPKHRWKTLVLCMAVHNYVPSSPLLSRNIRGGIGRWRVLKNMWEISENKKGRNVWIKQRAPVLKVGTSGSPLAQRPSWRHFLQEIWSKHMQ